MIERLFIHHSGTLVGSLDFDTEDESYTFEYNSNWMKNGFEISPSMPFGIDIPQLHVKSFVENLLPEGNGLEDLSIFLQISKNNKFAILKEIGLDTTGALTFSTTPIYEMDTSFRELPYEELAQRVSQREHINITIWDDKPRLSVAGVQAKLPITIRDGIFGFGEGNLCSTHILKFNKKNVDVTLNEFFSLRLLKVLGFDVCNVEYKKIGDEYVLFVERFDRKIISHNHIKKIHIIDSVQALGMRVSFKYERNLGKGNPNIKEGVSFSKLFSLATFAKTPLVFKEKIIDFSITTLLLGNTDAHGKNISFFVDEKGLEVAPLYDILNVSMIDNFEHDLAMGFDEEFEYDELSVYAFREFFLENDIKIDFYFDKYKHFVYLLADIFEDFDYIRDEILGTTVFEKQQEFLETYISNTKNRINKISKILNEVRYTLPYENQSADEFIKDEFKEVKKVLGKSFVDRDSKHVLDLYMKKIESKLIVEI